MKLVCKFINTYGNLENTINNCLNNELIEAYPDISINPNDDVILSFFKIYSKTQEKFIFIIDECDVVYREKKYKIYTEEYLEFLNAIAKDSPRFVSLVYLTGILPLEIGLTQSLLNNVKVISLINSIDYDDFIGFTEDEVKVICDDYNNRESTQKSVDFDEVKFWYNGYKLRNGTRIYNPYAINKLLEGTIPDVSSHWSYSSSIEFLQRYIVLDELFIDTEIDSKSEQHRKQNINYAMKKIRSEYLYEEVVFMAGNIKQGQKRPRVKANINGQIQSIDYFESKDEIYNILVVLGYLTYDFETQECFIPNEDVAVVFVNILKKVPALNTLFDKLQKSEELLNKTIELDANYVSKNFNVECESTARKAFFKNHDALQAFVQVAYYFAFDNYDIEYEVDSGRGFADVIFKPHNDLHPSLLDKRPPIIIELKHFDEKLTDERRDKEAKLAIEQIIKKKYYSDFKEYEKIILVSLIYYIGGDNEYTHHCIIEEFKG